METTNIVRSRYFPPTYANCGAFPRIVNFHGRNISDEVVLNFSKTSILKEKFLQTSFLLVSNWRRFQEFEHHDPNRSRADRNTERDAGIKGQVVNVT